MPYIGKEPTTGNFVYADDITTSSTNTYNILVGGVAFSPESANHLIVSLNGVIQKANTSFSVSGSQITFLPSSGTLSSSDSIDFILILGTVNDVGVATTVSDSAITKNKLNLISTSGSPGLEVKGDGSSENGTIALNCSSNSHAVKISSPSHASGQSYEMILPTTNITAGKFLKVDSVSGSGATGIGQLSFADAGGGKVNQVVQTHKTDIFSTTNGINGSGFTDITGLSVNITPSATTSKILIVANIMCSISSQDRIYFRLQRGGAVIGNADTVSSGTPCIASFFQQGATTFTASVGVNFLDTPNSTSAQTYKFTTCSNQNDGSGTLRINGQGNSGNGASDDNTTSTITVMEILA